jgi:hypothetical protein
MLELFDLAIARYPLPQFGVVMTIRGLRERHACIHALLRRHLPGALDAFAEELIDEGLKLAHGGGM